MQHWHCAEAVDRMLQDICSSELPFGGVPVVFGGDFQQILPVIVGGTCADIVQACIQRSSLWQKIAVLHLKENMHLGQSLANHEYADWLKSVGKGENTAPDGTIILRPEMKCGNTLQSLIDATSHGLNSGSIPLAQYSLERSILALHNNDVDNINEAMIHQFPGQLREFYSTDRW